MVPSFYIICIHCIVLKRKIQYYRYGINDNEKKQRKTENVRKQKARKGAMVRKNIAAKIPTLSPRRLWE